MPAGEVGSVRRGNPSVPRAPWGAFPLSELLVILSVIFAAFGVLSWGSARGVWAFGAAMTLGCLAGLEVSLREHLAGYRPHSTVLAGTAALLSGAATFLLGVPAAIDLGLTLLVFLVASLRLARAFQRHLSDASCG
jgi:hypothetical protein